MRVLDCRRTESCRAAPILLTFWKFVCFLTETASFTFGFQEAEDVVFADGALDVTNDATVGVIHEFDTNLSDTTTGAGTAEDLDNASKLNRLLGSFLQCNWIQLLRWFTQNTSFFEVIRRHPSIIHKSIRNHPNMLLYTVAVVCVGLYVPLSLIPEKGRVNGSQSNAIFVGLLVLPPHSVEISTSDNYSSSSSSHLLPSIIDNHISSSFFPIFWRLPLLCKTRYNNGWLLIQWILSSLLCFGIILHVASMLFHSLFLWLRIIYTGEARHCRQIRLNWLIYVLAK